jgi:hypothetical protein
MVEHVCNLSTWEAEAGDHEFPFNPGYTARAWLKSKHTEVEGFECRHLGSLFHSGPWFQPWLQACAQALTHII